MQEGQLEAAPGEVELNHTIVNKCGHPGWLAERRTDLPQQLVRNLRVRRHLTKNVPS